MRLPTDLDQLFHELLTHQSVKTWAELLRLVILLQPSWVPRLEMFLYKCVTQQCVSHFLSEWIVNTLLNSITFENDLKPTLLRYCIEETVFRVAMSLKDTNEKCFRLLLLIYQTDSSCYWYKKRVHLLKDCLETASLCQKSSNECI